jgi:hypothetical protein
MNWVFDPKIKAGLLAKEVVEASFPKEHYDDIMVYEAWSMRHIMENLVEIALEEEWKEIRKWKPFLHWCSEWDGLLIDKNDPEFEVCTCFPKEKK